MHNSTPDACRMCYHERLCPQVGHEREEAGTEGFWPEQLGVFIK